MSIWDVLIGFILALALDAAIGANKDQPRYWAMEQDSTFFYYEQKTDTLRNIDFDSLIQTVIKEP